MLAHTRYSLLRFVCAALIIGGFIIIKPHFVEARYDDANVQCPAGGKKDQPCTDNTNGYTTKGTCSFVYVCKAKEVDPKTPPKCVGGAADCPTGKPYPPSFTPTPRPIQIASTSASIGATAVSAFEQGILNTVFSGDSNEAASDVDLKKVSADANTALRTLFEGTDEELLVYVPESFDAQKSTLFASLRDEAVTLSPSRLRVDGGLNVVDDIRLAYASGGAFGGGVTGHDDSDTVSLSTAAAFNIEWALFSQAAHFMGNALMHFARAFVAVFLADFSVASAYYTLALAEASTAIQLLWHILRSIFAEGILALRTLFSVLVHF